MQWVLPSRPARRPSAVRDAWRFTQVIGVHQAREGKVGENPLTYREALRKEKVRKNLWQNVGCLCVPLTPKNARMAGFYIPSPLAGHTTRQQWRNLTRTVNGYSRKFSKKRAETKFRPRRDAGPSCSHCWTALRRSLL
jgi:hypothetical protein